MIHLCTNVRIVEEWDDRNRLYSLRYELTCLITMPSRYLNQRPRYEFAMVFENGSNSVGHRG